MNASARILNLLEITPTNEQKVALEMAGQFISADCSDAFMIIQGSAGTGKSTIVKAITDYLNDTNQSFALAAPTGKAAKVMQSKTGYSAKTLHSLIYNTEQLENGYGVKLTRKTNLNQKICIYIVDEASMISDKQSSSEKFVSGTPLLSDFIKFVKEGNRQNKIIFIGDIYQLPPVGSLESPALSIDYLQGQKKLKGSLAVLTEVKRQGSDSYILKNATNLRKCIENGHFFQGIVGERISNRTTGALHKYVELYERENFGKVAFIAWTNKDVNWFNNAIRKRLGFDNTSLCAGDQISMHQNWLGNGHLILKGETGIIRSVNTNETYADMNFVTAEIEFTDHKGTPFLITSKVLIESLISETGEIGFENENTLFAEAMKRNGAFRESKSIADDKYLSALRLRYAYATTCHKAQGSEWEHVILHPYMNKDLRWQYTAITRASKELYTFAA
jgi:exodeoxyribonuclease-5